MSEQCPAKADAFHDARDDGFRILSPEEIEAYVEVLRRRGVRIAERHDLIDEEGDQ